MPKYIGSRGPINAKVFILAEAPGEQEEGQGIPLVGPTGKITERFAHEAGFALGECFIVNVVREHPPTYYDKEGKAVRNDIELFITPKKKLGQERGFILHNGLWIEPRVREWLAQLEKELALVKPALVLGLGRIALWALLKYPAKISEWRGTFFSRNDQGKCADGTLGSTQALASYHPAATFRNPDSAAYIARDFARVPAFLVTAKKPNLLDDPGEPVGGSQPILVGGISTNSERSSEPTQSFSFTIRPTLERAIELLTGLLERLRVCDGSVRLPVAVDIETKNKQIDCIGFGLSSIEAFCIPITCKDGSYWSLDEEIIIVDLLRKVLCHPNLEILGQNFSYDAQYLARQWGISFPAHLYDTMVSWHVLFPGLEKGLDVLNSLFADRPEQWKPENKEVSKRWTDEQNWTYNCRDCCATFVVAEQLPDLIAKEDLDSAWALQHRQLPVVQKMMLRGVRWNHALAKELDADLSQRIDRVQANIDLIAGHPLNLGSNGATGQMQRFFYDDLQIPKVNSRLTKKPSTGKEALPTIAKREPILRPLTQLIEHRRRMATYRSTFIRAKTDWDNRMRSSFNIAGTETFRPSSRGDAFWLGTNILNFPRGKETTFIELLEKEGPQAIESLTDEERDTLLTAAEVGFVSISNGQVSANPNFRLPNVRKLITPDPGFILASCDQSGADFQVVVWEAGDESLKQMLRAGMKVHKENAKIFGLNPEDPEDYDITKRFIHATDYGGKPRTMAASLSSMSGRKFTISQIEQWQHLWFSEHPKFKEWHERTLQTLKDKHEIRAVSGFRRYYFDPPESCLPEALAWVPQHLVAWVTNTGICNLDEQFESEGLQCLINVYDEAVFQFPRENLHRLPVYLEALKISIPYSDQLTIPMACKLSTKSWGECIPMKDFDLSKH